jgi:hypothetical protein
MPYRFSFHPEQKVLVNPGEMFVILSEAKSPCISPQSAQTCYQRRPNNLPSASNPSNGSKPPPKGRPQP